MKQPIVAADAVRPAVVTAAAQGQPRARDPWYRGATAVCLAVPAQITRIEGDNAVVDLQGNRLRVCVALTPEAQTGAWVLVHAGFAISVIDEAVARETWDYLHQAALAAEAVDEAGGES